MRTIQRDTRDDDIRRNHTTLTDRCDDQWAAIALLRMLNVTYLSPNDRFFLFSVSRNPSLVRRHVANVFFSPPTALPGMEHAHHPRDPFSVFPPSTQPPQMWYYYELGILYCHLVWSTNSKIFYICVGPIIIRCGVKAKPYKLLWIVNFIMWYSLSLSRMQMIIKYWGQVLVRISLNFVINYRYYVFYRIYIGIECLSPKLPSRRNLTRSFG